MEESIFDAAGYRYNVGIVLVNAKKQLFWAKRLNQAAWQFPQGGIMPGESAFDAMKRELFEEIGLDINQVQLLHQSDRWLQYDLPVSFRRKSRPGLMQCVGQKQKWFLLKILTNDEKINLQNTKNCEFDDWRWVDFKLPINSVVYFKKDVYRQILTEFAQVLSIDFN